MRVAVIIAGQLREWHRSAEPMFKYFSSQSDNVDYYFATWYVTRDYWWPEHISERTERPVLYTEITDVFAQHNQRLIDFQIVESIPRENITYYYQGYLTKLANIAKRKYELENNFVYDQVVVIRPDLYISYKKHQWALCNDYEYNIGPMYNDHNGVLSIEDFYFRSNSWTNDILSARNLIRADQKSQFIFSSEMDHSLLPCNHQTLSEWLLRRNLLYKPNDDYDFCFIIRPNFPKDLSTLSIAQAQQLDSEYIAYQWTE
jgi:hypothetical protein